ncbi:group III truncated hemoglobin [Gelidibacter sp. F2691]|nr:group III truncated hemoglobin [Gelidibacter sp. F2691]
MEHDIFSLEDVKTLVNTFYDKVREDALLAPIFNKVIKERWPEHLETMYTFWQTVLLGEHTYTGSPFPPHAKLPISKAHFDRWLELFYSTIDEHFEGEIAEEAKWRASKMAEIFQFKIDRYQQSICGHY